MTDWKDQFITHIAQGKFQEAFNIREQHFPKRLFKYTSLNRLDENLDALKEDNIWLSDPRKFNDPYDSALTFDGVQLGNFMLKKNFDDFSQKTGLSKHFNQHEIAVIRSHESPIDGLKIALASKYAGKEKIIDEIAAFVEREFSTKHKQLQQKLTDDLRGSLKMTCFSEIKNSILMWSHYASQHAGFCIEYDFTTLPANDPRHHLVYPVKYTDSLLDVTKMLIEYDSESLLATIASIHKSTEWSYEKEWRLIIPGGIMQKEGYYKVPAPVGIYIGARMIQQTRDRILEIAARKNIPAYEVHLKLNSFLLEATLLST